jgi:4'-phosphopantetheinyl transferase
MTASVGRTDIEIWLVDLDRLGPRLIDLERTTPRLDRDEAARAAALSDAGDSTRRLSAHVALRIVLERWCGPGIRGQPLPRDAHGKPWIGAGGIDFSLSHTQAIALIAVSGIGRIGCDIEAVREVKMAPWRVERLVAAAAGLTLETRPPDPIAAWTALEAFGKARGTGIGPALTDLDVSGRRLQLGEVRHHAQVVGSASGLVVGMLALPAGWEGYRAALAIDPPAGTGTGGWPVVRPFDQVVDT